MNAIKIEEVRYQVNDLTLAGIACGDETHPPLLCLHGYLDNSASFLPLMKEGDLLPNRRIIALDFAGHGHSEHRSIGAQYHFFDYVSDLFALFELNHWQAIDIVAHSMGGMIASAFAAAFPEKVKTLTLIDSFGFMVSPENKTTSQLRRGVLSRLKIVKPSRAFTEESAIKARMQVSDLQFEHAKMIMQRSLVEAESNTIEVDDNRLCRWRSDARLRTLSLYRLSLAQGQQLYQDIKCPLQLVSGDKGMSMVHTGLKSFVCDTTIFKHTVLVGGHHIHMEKTRELIALLADFIDEIKTSV